MPANRSYDVFLLETGTELSLISTSFIQSQPSLTVAHDTQVFITKTITKTSDKQCTDITIAEKMNCIIDKVGKDLLSNGTICIPFYFYKILSRAHPEFYQCEDETAMSQTMTFFEVTYV